MKPNENFLTEYDILVYDDRFKLYRPVKDDETKKAVIEKCYIVPLNSNNYMPKNIILGVIENNAILYYKAIRK